jgi:hypothetical protein
MAHRADTRQIVRRGYVSQRLPLIEAARQAGVSVSSARLWRDKSLKAGDDWDRARDATELAEGGLGSITERVLRDFTQLFTHTMARLTSEDGDPIETASAIARLSYSYARTVKAAGAVDPQLARLSIGLETLEMLGEFIRRTRPEAVAVLLDLLEPFGAELSVKWS